MTLVTYDLRASYGVTKEKTGVDNSPVFPLINGIVMNTNGP